MSEEPITGEDITQSTGEDITQSKRKPRLPRKLLRQAFRRRPSTSEESPGHKLPRGLFGQVSLRKVSSQSDLQNHHKERERNRLDATPAGPGLKKYEVDMGLFEYSTDWSALTKNSYDFYDTFQKLLKRYAEMMDEYYEAHPDKKPNVPRDNSEIPDFYQIMMSSMSYSHPTPELQEWLDEHTLQNGYFTPEMIEEAVADDPDIAVHEEAGEHDIKIWRFSDQVGNYFTLSRAQDGSRPSVRTTPYLSVAYQEEYDFDTKELITIPKFRSKIWFESEGDEERKNLRDSPLARKLMEKLGIHETRTPQEIIFKYVDSETKGVMTLDDVGLITQPVMTQPHIIADLPHHEHQ